MQLMVLLMLMSLLLSLWEDRSYEIVFRVESSLKPESLHSTQQNCGSAKKERVPVVKGRNKKTEPDYRM